jgi:predicted ATP-dependent endonuclease of OLD family
MIQSLTATGFRCFREIRVEPLTRVNLFVGENNAGKTSLLEAVELLAAGGVQGLARSAVRRGEQILARSEAREYKDHLVDPSHLFYGHELRLGASFKIWGGERRVRCTVEQASKSDTLIRTLLFESDRSDTNERLTISPLGGVLPPPRWMDEEQSPRVNFLAAEATDVAHLGQLWDALVLTPEEQEVIESLRVIEPRLERLAFLSESRGPSVPLVKLKDSEKRLPLGSLGGGLRHLLALVLHLLSARGGFLLADEIDTGLHYSVMVDMWRLLIDSAKRLDVQVFATTHSLDCVRALARLRKKDPKAAAEVTVHRVEKDAPRTVVYDADEIVVAADSQIEVR